MSGGSAKPAQEGGEAQTHAIEVAIVDKLRGNIVEELRGELRRVERRIDELVIRIDQIDARISLAISGDAPSALDDLDALIEPIEQLRKSIENLQQVDSPS